MTTLCKNCGHELVYYDKNMACPMVLWKQGYHHKRRMYLENCWERIKYKFCGCTNPEPKE